MRVLLGNKEYHAECVVQVVNDRKQAIPSVESNLPDTFFDDLEESVEVDDEILNQIPAQQSDYRPEVHIAEIVGNVSNQFALERQGNGNHATLMIGKDDQYTDRNGNPLEHSCFMWWDSLAYGYYMEEGIPADDDGKEIQQEMFMTLKRILEIDSEDCQKSALHGLGHLKHPETEVTIKDFLKLHSVSERLKDYALACIAGTMDRSHSGF